MSQAGRVPRDSDTISAASAMHSSQIATSGVGPQTMRATAWRGLPQNEQWGGSEPGPSSGSGVNVLPCQFIHSIVSLAVRMRE